MQKHAAMFDLDGTLLDTLADLGDSMNITLAALGFPTHDYPFYRKAVGDGAPQLVTRSLPPAARTPDTIQAALIRMRAEYERRWTLKTGPYDGILALLEDLRRRGTVITVLSNKPDAKTRDCVAHFFPDVPFAAVRGAREGVPLKPDPAAALAILRELDIPAEEWLYVGDTDTDMQTAVSAGIFAVGAAWGFRDRDELLAHGARSVIDSPAELLPLLG
jgi:phosphoglycolate phosphatase